jgi:penicillin-binding protein 1A
MFPEEIGRSRTLDRKLREIITALRSKTRIQREQILETYLNSVPFRYNMIGIERAARTYFNKSASDLDKRNVATLVDTFRTASDYNPIINPERAQKRRNVVLSQMVNRGILFCRASIA